MKSAIWLPQFPRVTALQFHSAALREGYLMTRALVVRLASCKKRSTRRSRIKGERSQTSSLLILLGLYSEGILAAMKIFYFLVLLALFGFSALADSLPSNGLGLTLNEWELNHKPTGQGMIGTMYDQIEVVFQNNKISQVELNLELPISVEKAIEFATSLLPRDAKFVQQYSPKYGAKTLEFKKVFLYASEFLQGEFHYQYNQYNNPAGVTRVIIALGNEPLKTSALKEQKRNIDFYFENCETLQMKYPDGVPEGHPAYRPSLDRNRNGWACEPTPR
jgi:hypothetical protein